MLLIILLGPGLEGLALFNLPETARAITVRFGIGKGPGGLG